MNNKPFIRKCFKPAANGWGSNRESTIPCTECCTWKAKYCTLEQKYLALQDECNALRAERSTRLIKERSSSWQTNWKY